MVPKMGIIFQVIYERAVNNMSLGFLYKPHNLQSFC